MILFNKSMIFIMVLISFSSLTLNAKEDCKHKVSIRVLDQQTKETIPGAEIGLNQLSGITDFNGLISFEEVCLGKNHLHIQALGYEYVDTDIIIKQNDTFTFSLSIARKSLDEVEITGHKQALSTTTSLTTLNKKELNKSTGGSLANAIESVSGVNMLQTGSTISKPVINGMHSNRILVLNNGLRQEGQQWGVEHAPEIDPFTAQKITVVKGAEAIRYGSDAIGGVIILDPPVLPTDSSLHGSFNLVGASNGRMIAGSAMLSGHFAKAPSLAWRIQGSGKKSGNVQTADYFLENTGSTELNYSAATAYTREHFDIDLYYSHFQTNLGIFKGSHIGSLEDLKQRIADGRPFDDGSFSYNIEAPQQKVAHDLFKLRSHLHLNDYLHLTAIYGLQKDSREEFDIRRGSRTDVPSLNFILWNQNLDITLDYFNGKHLKGIFGLSGNYQNNKSPAGTFTTPLIPDYIAQSLGVFGVGTFLKQHYQIELGLRYDYKTLNALGYRSNNELYGGRHNYSNLAGSLGFSWNLKKGWDLNSNVGSAWRAPSVNELYSTGLHHGAASFELGNDQLKTEQSIKWITTLSHQNRGKWFKFDLDVYTHFFDHYIYLNPTGEFNESLRGSFPVFNYQQTNARFLGLDLSTQITFFKQLDYDLKFSFINAKDMTHDSYLPMIPANRFEHSIKWRIADISKLKSSYIQFTHIYTTKQSNANSFTDFAPAPKAYHLFNLNLGTQLPIADHDFQIDFTIKNLSNLLYKDYMNRFRYYAHDLGRSFELRLAYQF